jgi:hypothetical protein
MALQILFEAWFELFKPSGGVQYVIGDTHTLYVFIAVNHRKIHQFIQKGNSVLDW